MGHLLRKVGLEFDHKKYQGGNKFEDWRKGMGK